MRNHLLLLALLSFGMVQANAQRELLNPLVDSKEVINNGVALHDAAKYKEAIAEYLKVPASDTSYSTILHE